MLEPEQVALILLAAGRSRRFDGDKLTEPFLDKPLACHVVTALANIPFCLRVAVVAKTGLDFAEQGYQVVASPAETRGQARSLRPGIAAAKAAGCRYALVALADMPRVTAAHVYRLLDAANCHDSVVASSDGKRPMPPALFGSDHFDALLDPAAEDTAHALIRAGRHVIATPAELVDINTRTDLAELRARYGLKTDGT